MQHLHSSDEHTLFATLTLFLSLLSSRSVDPSVLIAANLMHPATQNGNRSHADISHTDGAHGHVHVDSSKDRHDMTPRFVSEHSVADMHVDSHGHTHAGDDESGENASAVRSTEGGIMSGAAGRAHDQDSVQPNEDSRHGNEAFESPSRGSADDSNGCHAQSDVEARAARGRMWQDDQDMTDGQNSDRQHLDGQNLDSACGHRQDIFSKNTAAASSAHRKPSAGGECASSSTEAEAGDGGVEVDGKDAAMPMAGCIDQVHGSGQGRTSPAHIIDANAETAGANGRGTAVGMALDDVGSCNGRGVPGVGTPNVYDADFVTTLIHVLDRLAHCLYML
jgi:hypothetical protein